MTKHYGHQVMFNEFQNLAKPLCRFIKILNS